MAQLFDDGVVLDELLGVGVGELDRTAPAEEVLGRSDGGTELGIDGVAPVGGQARDGVDVDFAEDAGLVEEEGLDAARGAKRGWGFVREGVKGLGGDRRVDVGDDLVQTDGLVGDGDPVAAAAMSSRRARCSRTGVSLHSCINSSPLRISGSQGVEGRP